MSVRLRFMGAAVAGLWMALPLPGQEPARLELGRGQAVITAAQASANQQLADRVADSIRQSSRLKDFDIDIAAKDGIVELTGTVTDAGQKQEALQTVRVVSGVVRVVDKMELKASLRQVRATMPGVQVPENGHGGMMPEPMPVFQGSTIAGSDQYPPPMPPHAWPTYAPYNNFSRVGYPEAYPYQSFPFIGPFYPFPKVPPGWRSVKLEWQDGHWWYSKVATRHDWWRVRYW